MELMEEGEHNLKISLMSPSGNHKPWDSQMTTPSIGDLTTLQQATPTTVLGDADKNGADSNYYTSGGQSYDSYYQSGGNTVNGNAYSLMVSNHKMETTWTSQ